MITCQHVRQLFDRYLDGELSPSLQAELHAHQLTCSMCQTELAMLEACGDVVALDRCEPKLSASFTNRVLLARRGQLAGQRRHGRGRVALVVGGPIAAAAGILLALMLTMPSEPAKTGTLVHGETVAAPKAIQDALGGREDRTDQEKRELETTKQMPAVGFMDALLARVVEQTGESVDGARRNLAELELLVRQGGAGANERLVAQWSGEQGKTISSDGGADRPISELDVFDPRVLNAEPANETSAEPPLLDPL